MSGPPAIAVDGPAASGKTVVGRRLAQLLGYRFLDTGAMYRAVTLLALEQSIALDDAEALTRIAKEMDFHTIEPAAVDREQGGDSPRVLVNGRNVTSDVRSPRVDRAVSQVSQVPGVRYALVRLQQEIGRQGSVVMVGRDIGTVVLPDAKLKVFLEASAAVRARRRYEEMAQHGVATRYADVLADLRHRDKIDSERAISPLVPAVDAQTVNTDSSTIDEVVETLWRLTAKP